MITVEHPGRVNDPWDWLKTVAKDMSSGGGEMRDGAWMLHTAYQAYLGEGIEACVDVVRQYAFVTPKGEKR